MWRQSQPFNQSIEKTSKESLGTKPGQIFEPEVYGGEPRMPSSTHMTSEKIYKKHENEKKREYNSRIMNIEHATFTPLVFSTNGGAGPECEMFHKHIAQLISDKTGERYGHVMSYIRCKLSFLILRACLTCLRGSRPHKPKTNEFSATQDYTLACDDARLPPM